MTWVRTAALGVVLGALALVGCDAGEPAALDPPDEPKPTEPAEAEADVANSPSPTTLAPTTPPPDPPHPVSLPALFEADFDGRDLEVARTLEANAAYTRYAVTYNSSYPANPPNSDDLTISGIMNVPSGDGPFPVLVLAHGYIDPAIYTTGRGLAREQDYLARQGYVVLHTDYRNHAASDNDPDSDAQLRLGYTADVINAVLAVRESDLPYLDGARVGLLARSMGGGVTYNALVTAPGLVDAAVLYAPVSSEAADNFDQWQRDQPVGDEILAAYGEPEDEPEFWADVSPRTFFDRITEPVLIHHGTADDTCPIEWSYITLDALDDAGVDAELIEHDGEPHTFEAGWQASIEQTVAFFDTHLD